MFSDPTNTRTLLQFPEPLSEFPAACVLPLAGCRISAGFPSPAADYIDAGLDIGKYLIRNKISTFVFTVEGNSMTGARIFDGDKLVVDRSIDARHRHIVVAVVNGEFTVKRLYNRAGVVELRPENPAYPAIQCKDFDDVQVWGVVTGVLRKFLV
jgi:DNA polymerase V